MRRTRCRLVLAALAARQARQPRLTRTKRASGPVTLVSFRPTRERWEFEDQHAVMYLALHSRPQRGAAPG